MGIKNINYICVCPRLIKTLGGASAADAPAQFLTLPAMFWLLTFNLAK
jgi:hypothetical protein